MLGLARRAIGHYIETSNLLEIPESELPSKKLKENLACFVTLTINGKLRGCIGHLEAVEPLYQDIIGNAVSAAFNDYRFEQLTKKEFAGTDIEISVLSKPEPLSFSSPEDLLDKLKPDIDGIILRKGDLSATYLPQVWEELPDKNLFLSSLCEKAGLGVMDWKKPGIEIGTYTVEAVK